jgi:hypothetical protein
MDINPPPGMWAATGATAAKAPTLTEIRRGSFSTDGWHDEHQRHKAGGRGSLDVDGETPSSRKGSYAQDSSMQPRLGKEARTSSSGAREMLGTEPFPTVTEEEMSTVPTRDSMPARKTFLPPNYAVTENDMREALDSKQSYETVDADQSAPLRSLHVGQV